MMELLDKDPRIEDSEPKKRAEPLTSTQRFWLSLAAIVAAWSYAMVGTILSMVGR